MFLGCEIGMIFSKTIEEKIIMEKLKGMECGDAEECKEMCRSALCLASMKHEKLSTEKAMASHELKTKVARQIKARRNKPNAQRASNNPTEERVLALNSYFPPEIPPVECLQGLIGRRSKPFEKQLTESDVQVSQCRLSINKLDVQNSLMPLLREGEVPSQGIPVKVYDAEGKEYSMTFKIWSSKLHVLKEGWINFCHDHCLLAHQDFVTLWPFRHLQTGGLCFVIISRRLEVFETIKRKKLN